MTNEEPDDEGSTDPEEIPLDPPKGATDEQVRVAVEDLASPGRNDGGLDASQDGTQLVIYDGDGPEDADERWIRADTETVDPMLTEVRQ